MNWSDKVEVYNIDDTCARYTNESTQVQFYPHSSKFEERYVGFWALYPVCPATLLAVLPKSEEGLLPQENLSQLSWGNSVCCWGGLTGKPLTQVPGTHNSSRAGALWVARRGQATASRGRGEPQDVCVKGEYGVHWGSPTMQDSLCSYTLTRLQLPPSVPPRPRRGPSSIRTSCFEPNASG